MKKLLALILALAMCLSLAGCGDSGRSRDAQEDSASETSQENSETEGNDTHEPEEPEAKDPVDENEIASLGEADFPYFPWFEQLPDGIEAEIQKLNDFELLIHYKNNTGRDVAFYTECQFFDGSGEDGGWMSEVNEFVKDGDDYVAVMECNDYFESYLLYCEIDNPGARIQMANDALSVQSSKNSDGSIHLDMKTTADDGTSVSGYVVFTNSDGLILGYEYVGWGFGEEMDGDTEIPGFEYDDYFICISAIA